MHEKITGTKENGTGSAADAKGLLAGAAPPPRRSVRAAGARPRGLDTVRTSRRAVDEWRTPTGKG